MLRGMLALCLVSSLLSALPAEAKCVKDHLIAKSILGDSIQTDNGNDLVIFSGGPFVISWQTNDRLLICKAANPYLALYPQYNDVYKVIDLDRQLNNEALGNLNDPPLQEPKAT